LAGWQNGSLAEWQVDKMAVWLNGKLAKWHVGKLIVLTFVITNKKFSEYQVDDM
jgi:hypothetical protein